MTQRTYYRWLGKLLMITSVLLPIWFTLLAISIVLGGDLEKEMRQDALQTILIAYGICICGFLFGRLLARIPPDQ